MTDDADLDKARTIAAAWGLTDPEAQQLLDDPRCVSCVLNIDDSLCRIYPTQERARAWPVRPNRAFDDKTPLDVMLSGGIEQVRKYLRYHVYNA
jgi:hypothetical protein